jgi:hypothetical protein
LAGTEPNQAAQSPCHRGPQGGTSIARDADPGLAPIGAGGGTVARSGPFIDPRQLVHCLMFLLEFSESPSQDWRKHRRALQFFLSRSGGLHLLMMLLNAWYQKPLAGRRPGWVFCGLRARVGISERALRMLIRDAMSEGLVELLPPATDARTRSYRLTPRAVEAWEALVRRMESTLPDVMHSYGPDALANVDYRAWNPKGRAASQIPLLPPSHLVRRRI